MYRWHEFSLEVRPIPEIHLVLQQREPRVVCNTHYITAHCNLLVRICFNRPLVGYFGVCHISNGWTVLPQFTDEKGYKLLH